MRFSNLFVGYNKEEDFRILICAFDITEACDLAREYGFDAGLSGSFEISEPKNGIDNIHFDCDYVIA